MLVSYKQPRSYEFVTENIRDDAGKVRRTQLRDERIAKMKQQAPARSLGAAPGLQIQPTR
jgi:bile acid-coenzyme A ligase